MAAEAAPFEFHPSLVPLADGVYVVQPPTAFQQ